MTRERREEKPGIIQVCQDRNTNSNNACHDIYLRTEGTPLKGDNFFKYIKWLSKTQMKMCSAEYVSCFYCLSNKINLILFANNLNIPNVST